MLNPAVHPGQPFVELRCMRIQSVYLAFPNVADVDGNIGREWHGLLEMIFEVEKDRISRQGSDVRANIGYHHQIRGILDDLRRIAMVRVIVIRAMREDDVCPPFANLADDLTAGCHAGD